jgi:pilus assembly protein CpaF
MADFLRICVRYRKNIIVSGGTGSGKTTFLNALSESIASDERIVTIEDAAELRLVQPHVLSLEARPANVEGRGEVTIRELVRNALRMRPDRIIVGECRGSDEHRA